MARRLEFHYTPKHASWLNMVEIEIGVLRSQCLDRRIATREDLEAEIGAWEAQRNGAGARIEWMFTTDKARTKLAKAYPKLKDVCAFDTSGGVAVGRAVEGAAQGGAQPATWQWSVHRSRTTAAYAVVVAPTTTFADDPPMPSLGLCCIETRASAGAVQAVKRTLQCVDAQILYWFAPQAFPEPLRGVSVVHVATPPFERFVAAALVVLEPAWSMARLGCDERIRRSDFGTPTMWEDGALPEDLVISLWYRTILERDFGIRFCPPELANRFSVEAAYHPFCSAWVGRSFGFHGLAAAPYYGVHLDRTEDAAIGIA